MIGGMREIDGYIGSQSRRDRTSANLPGQGLPWSTWRPHQTSITTYYGGHRLKPCFKMNSWFLSDGLLETLSPINNQCCLKSGAMNSRKLENWGCDTRGRSGALGMSGKKHAHTHSTLVDTRIYISWRGFLGKSSLPATSFPYTFYRLMDSQDQRCVGS